MKFLYALLFAGITSSMLLGEENAHQQLSQMVLIEQQGQFAKVIEIVPQLLNSDALTADDRGRAWTLLGAAYQSQGNFMQAQSAYEHALQIFSPDPILLEEYAAALEGLAGLYRDMRQLQTATPMEEKALAVYEKRNNHSAIARSCATLAELELYQNHRRDTARYLSRALREASSAGDHDEDVFAAISSTQAWLALLNSDTKAAIIGYEHTVELWRQKHGEQHFLTGWGYMLLGKAYSQAGQDNIGLDNMRKGLSILEFTLGRENPKYLVSELAYARVLDHIGQHAEAARINDLAGKPLVNLFRNQCINCRISVAALR